MGVTTARCSRDVKIRRLDEMTDVVRKLAADSGILRYVAGQRSPEGYEWLEFNFDRGTLRLTCDADTDQIVVDAIKQQPSEFDGFIGDDGALASLVGKVIEHAWMMVNDRGYRDAFQIRCVDVATRSESCCQFEVAASALTVTRVSPVPLR